MSNSEVEPSEGNRVPVVSEIVIDGEGRLFISNLSEEALEALAELLGSDPLMVARYQALCRYRERKEQDRVA